MTVQGRWKVKEQGGGGGDGWVGGGGWGGDFMEPWKDGGRQ